MHENKTIQLCFLPNAGGLWKLGGGGGAVQGKGGPVSCGQRSQGARVLQFQGQNQLAMQVELWFSPRANLQTLERGNLANASGTIFACRVEGKARGRKRLHTPHTHCPPHQGSFIVPVSLPGPFFLHVLCAVLFHLALSPAPQKPRRDLLRLSIRQIWIKVPVLLLTS